MAPMASRLDVQTLRGRRVQLVSLRPDHGPALLAAAGEGRSSFGYTFVPSSPAEMKAHIAALLGGWEAGTDVPFAQIDADTGRPVGMTRYLTIQRWSDSGRPYSVEIGGTWLSASAQRSGLNRESKLLLLTHAFESWGVGRVALKTDARNERSRRAIAGIGASFEGVLRSWQPSLVVGEEGRLRDTAMYSVVAAEWAEVKQRLEGLVGGAT
jgi:RimJ/RimL family protein N-acetyltransferase